MTQSQWIRRVVKPAVFLVALIPLILIVRDILTGNLDPEPIKDLTHRTGRTGLKLLLATLAITPLRKLTHRGALISLRRMLGLLAFFYICLHFSIYVADQSVFSGEGLSMALVVEDLSKRPYITVGFTAFLLLIPLAITSTNGWVRRLGGKRWQALHRLIYISVALGVLHFLWLVKADISRPVAYGSVLIVLLAARLWRQRRARFSAAGRRPSASRTEVPMPPAPAA